eukprot:CAMPEP_0178736806 /NCGR_PEP_ID=MMETSP0744-20121128/2638_1 /TAXON_ID=913974 /ORGANISM="Nitzschia punctata, Strain CCMP561" /LENGTH=188 /DNA_ID=CAMNT_0020389307 /DNA_START=152 /DNA_END=718 /DNA_ORIENTATION=-
MLTKTISSGLIAASGDIICQYLSHHHHQHHPELLSGDHSVEKDQEDTTISTKIKNDWYRTGRFFLMGSLWVAPVTSYWYTTLATRLVPGKTTAIRVAKRLALDQFGFAPLFCPSFMGLLWLLEGYSMTDVGYKVVAVAPDIIVANWVLWIPAMAINFSVIPLKFQVLYGNVIALLWNVYISYMSSKEG